jgi:hypothetical protein
MFIQMQYSFKVIVNIKMMYLIEHLMHEKKIELMTVTQIK